MSRHIRFVFPAVMAALLLVFAATASAEDEGPARITDVQVSGNKKVESETIRSKISAKVGDPFLPSRVRGDVSAIYKMGYFDDVRVEADGYAGGLRLTFNVVERPIISSFRFEGNKKLEESKLREKVNLSPYSIYNPALVAENVERLKLFYKGEGYYNARVLPVVRMSPKEVKVTFLIEEGDKVTISRIAFVGNEKISSRKLRRVMSTRKYTPIWSWIMKTGTYNVVEFDTDIERIKGLYYNTGYIQVAVDEPKVELSPDGKKLSITVPIHEGDQFRYGKVDVTGNKIFTKEELLKGVKMKPGNIMDRDEVKQDVVALTDLYGTKGYAFATISPVMNPDVSKKLVDMSLDVNEGDKIFVNRINVSGNTKTRDKVIRREIPFEEGEVFNTAYTKKSYERLRNLDFFEDVEIMPDRKGLDNKVDLSVKVKEKSTGSFSVGGGYSTVDRLVAIGEVTQNNFLGRGEMLKFKGSFGSRSQDYVISFLEPWLLDRPVSLKLDLFKEERTYTDYAVKSLGGSITLGKRFWEYWGVSGSYSYSDNKYTNVAPSMVDFIGAAKDLHTTGRIGISVYRDSRDNYQEPRRGSNNSIYGEVATTYFGGQNAFWKVIGDTTWYFPFRWDTTFSVHARVGYEDSLQGKPLQVFERFYVGGMGTVRGFDFGSLGPKNSKGQFIGGNKELIFNGEYTFPVLPSLKMRGVAFVDSGTAYDIGEGMSFAKLRYSAGGGIRWTSPVGLIRLEYGYVLNHKAGEKPGKFEFSMGTMF